VADVAMKDSNSVLRTKKRGRGRPATNPTSIHLTLLPRPMGEVDAWIAQQEELLTRPEAIRRLVEIGLRRSELKTRRSSS